MGSMIALMWVAELPPFRIEIKRATFLGQASREFDRLLREKYETRSTLAR